MRVFRLFRIVYTLERYGLYQILRDSGKTSTFAAILHKFLFFIPVKQRDESLPERSRLAFEELGPVFIKFGQLLSTRQDLLPSEYVVALSKLQSQVKPFPGGIAKSIVEKSLKDSIDNIFSEFSEEAVASASIAQVHKAVLRDTNQAVAVKVLRPGIEEVIAKDVKVLKLAAWFVEKVYCDGKRLKPQDVVVEFEKTIHAELDFMEEAANATELWRLHKNDNKIRIPRIYYDYSTTEVIVLEWMDGTPILDLDTLRARNINLETLSHNGVAIFYTQVFHYGFFHADMHPGNILCDDFGRYIALDFGIVGSLSEEDKRYLAINILAFFNRDYKRVAITHIESGWAPVDTSVEELESAIRTVCEPIFNKPLAEISFGQVLIKLFQVSRKFNISVQPQLLLLQKTIVNVEGLGRILNPNLDLWVTAKPILEKWMSKQMGIRGLLHNIKNELPHWSYILPKIPRAFANSLNNKVEENQYVELIKNYQRTNRFLVAFILVLAIPLLISLWKII